MLKSLCQDNDIILLQEHWLLKSNLYKLEDINDNFQVFSISAMDKKAEASILAGRPFGGCAIMYRKSLSNRMQLLEYDKNEGRYITMRLRCKPSINKRDLVITCVYFPCLTVYNKYIVNSAPIIAHIENMLNNNADDYHLIGGDYNFEFHKNNIGLDTFKGVTEDYNLICCDDKTTNKNIGYTYIHETLNQHSWLDHFIVSKSMYDFVSRCDIIDTGENLSDHCALKCSINLRFKDVMCFDSLDGTAKQRYKLRWDKADLVSYYAQSGSLLKSIVTPVEFLHCSTGCKCVNHRYSIDLYYNAIINMLNRATAGCVPKMPFKCLKPYWSDELDKLKTISIDMHNLWRLIGSPRDGIINAARLSAKLNYKQAIKQAAKDFEQNNANDLNQFFTDKKSTEFWRLWNSKFQKHVSQPATIEGHSDPVVIANTFKNFYANIYVDSSCDASAVAEFNNVYSSMTDGVINDKVIVDVKDVERCIKMLKINKAASFDGIMSEHILYCHPAIIVHLKILFSLMLTHAYVPDAFGLGIVIPIVKDRHGDLSNVDNYRPITISPVVSKIFESLLLDRYTNVLCTDSLQFGFKKGIGCSDAIFALRQCVNYFNEGNSNVYIASLDASKAFDRVNHYKLFTTLIKKGLPKFVVDTIIIWYSKLSVSVRWNGHDSLPLSVKSGVRQGGILSPIFFNVYINCMLTSLRKLGNGCHVDGMFLGCIMYADDLLLISASVMELQSMLDSCSTLGLELGINFNGNKSKCLCIGPNKGRNPEPMLINNSPITWCDKIKYLGVTIISCKRFMIDFADTRRKFFASINGILSKCNLTCDMVKLDLLEKHCLPVLLYAIEALNVKDLQLKEINSWWNAAYRKIFGFNKWDSVKQLICLAGRLDVLHIVNMRQLNFIKRLLRCKNEVINGLMFRFLHSRELVNMQCRYNSSIWWSSAKIKAMMFVSFKNICN